MTDPCIPRLNTSFTLSYNRIRQQLLPLVGAADALRAIASCWLAPQLRLLNFRTSILDTTDIPFLLRRRRRCSVALFFAINRRFTRNITESSSCLHTNVSHITSNVNIHYERAQRPPAVAIDVIDQWAGLRVSIRHTCTATAATTSLQLPVLKMSGTDVTNSLTVNYDCFLTFRNCDPLGYLPCDG